jgi:COMPASS component SWD3
MTHSSGNMNIKGHANRVYSVKFINDDPNVYVTGGWDSNFFLWDTREREMVGVFEGVSISGDALDYKSNRLLAG